MGQHVVRVDDEVWETLSQRSKDLNLILVSRNTVLRKILGLQDNTQKSCSSSVKKRNYYTAT
jgi:hypothetical protein